MMVKILGKKEKYGNYICKIGYLDIRQKIDLPRRKKNYRGEWETISGNIDVFVYHGKNKIAGPFKSHTKAITTAHELIGKGYKFNKKRKQL